jgi:UDP-N-acetylmuramyl pentapeptide synthase
MDILAELAAPDAAILANIGSAHLEFFQNPSGIAAEKSKLLQAVAPEGYCGSPRPRAPIQSPPVPRHRGLRDWNFPKRFLRPATTTTLSTARLHETADGWELWLDGTTQPA